uniref:Shieldin complex subunit 3 n=1 Tax=Mola mola TaxID=94237 RepID=A0A3Q3WW38_MOLML
MEDVVLHYQPGTATGLSSLLERTEKLLECFPCRTTPAFTLWFPMAADCHLPIRPARPAPIITASESRPHTSPNRRQKPGSNALFVERPHECLHGNRSSQPLSRHFSHMVSAHRLHPRQRVKWVISEHNCGVWRAVSRSVQSSQLPTCNANIQREQAEIWVFCDVVRSEQVGRFLKDQLQLSGSIRLAVHRQGDIFSM